MKSLSRELMNRRAEIIGRLKLAKLDLGKALAKANAMIEVAQAEANSHLNVYNSELAAARILRDEIVEEIEEYIGGKSEKWQESEIGQAYVIWRDSFDATDLDDIDLNLPSEIESEEPVHADEMEEWDEQPD